MNTQKVATDENNEPAIRSYRDLKVWKTSVDLVTEIYKKTSSFPKSEIYGLTSQIRRSSFSISSNIAEGAGRQSTRDYIRFITFAEGSLAELDTQLIISKNLGYLSSNDVRSLLTELVAIRKMLNGLRRSLSRKLIGKV